MIWAPHFFLFILYPTPSLLCDDKKNDCGSHRGLFWSVLDEKLSLTSKRKKVKILVHCLDAYSCVIKNLKQKQIKEKTALSSARTKFVRSSTSPVGTLVKRHSSQRNVALPTPPPWFASLSRRRFPIIQTNFGLVRAGVTWNKGPFVWTLIGKFRSVQWVISWYEELSSVDIRGVQSSFERW